jgi:hypothetical protein
MGRPTCTVRSSAALNRPRTEHSSVVPAFTALNVSACQDATSLQSPTRTATVLVSPTSYRTARLPYPLRELPSEDIFSLFPFPHRHRHHSDAESSTSMPLDATHPPDAAVVWGLVPEQCQAEPWSKAPRPLLFPIGLSSSMPPTSIRCSCCLAAHQHLLQRQ